MADFLLSLTLSEFSAWRRFGDLTVFGARLVPLANGWLPETMREVDLRRVATLLPDHEEDFEVVHAIVDLGAAPRVGSLSAFEVDLAPAIELSIESLRSVYAVSERGLKSLRGKLGGDTPILGVLAPSVVSEREQRRSFRVTERGARVLPRLLGLRPPPEEVDTWVAEVLGGLSARERSDEWPLTGKSYWANLVCYDRRYGQIDRNSDVGYLQDVVYISRELLKTAVAVGAGEGVGPEDARSAVKLLAECLVETKNAGGGRLQDLLLRYRTELQAVDRYFAGSDACIAAIALKMRRVVEERDEDGLGTLRALSASLQANGLGVEASTAAWLTGAFFGFARFADAYSAALIEKRDVGASTVSVVRERPQPFGGGVWPPARAAQAIAPVETPPSFVPEPDKTPVTVPAITGESAPAAATHDASDAGNVTAPDGEPQGATVLTSEVVEPAVSAESKPSRRGSRVGSGRGRQPKSKSSATGDVAGPVEQSLRLDASDTDPPERP